MMRAFRATTFLLFLCVLMVCSFAKAAIPDFGNTSFARYPAAAAAAGTAPATAPTAANKPALANLVLNRAQDFSRGLDATCIKAIETDHTTQEDIARIIPSDMSPTNDSGQIAIQILDHSLSNWFNSEAVKSSSLGRTARQLEKTMESDVSFGGQASESPKHSLRFSVRATQTRADLQYSGLTNAQLSYFAAQAMTSLEIREGVDLIGTELVYNHISSNEDTRQTVSMRWNW